MTNCYENVVHFLEKAPLELEIAIIINIAIGHKMSSACIV